MSNTYSQFPTEDDNSHSVLEYAVQHLHVDIRVHGEEEGQRVPLLARLVAHAVHRRGEEPVGLPLEVLAYVADERAFLRGRVDPLAGLVEDFECLNFVLANEREPCQRLSACPPPTLLSEG